MKGQLIVKGIICLAAAYLVFYPMIYEEKRC